MGPAAHLTGYACRRQSLRSLRGDNLALASNPVMKHVGAIGVLVSVAVAGCRLIPETVSADDPRLRPMFAAIERVDRRAIGFTPVSRDATIRLEVGPRRGYDAMLHIYGKTSRTIAFRSIASGYEWIGEQEIFEGPRRYETVDGEFQESITLTYDKVPISGVPVNQLSITYSGDDPALEWPRQLTLDDVRPILKRWGF